MSSSGAHPAGPERPSPWFGPIGAGCGFAGAVCGIGGGIFAGPFLHSVHGVPLRRAAATATLVVLATTLAATGGEVARGDSQLAWPVAVRLAVGALGGTQVGFALSRRIAERVLKRIFCVVLVLAGARLLFFSTALGNLATLEGLAGAALTYAVGFGGGCLTPLLGVAGGVFMVPALFLLGQPFGAARAAALAAGAVAGLRSLWLHARAGNVSFALGLPLAAGALVGALAGVVAAHAPGLAHAGRIGLGLVLLCQALVFARDLRGARAAQGAESSASRRAM